MRGHNTRREATFTRSYPQRSAPFHRAESVLSRRRARTRPSSSGRRRGRAQGFDGPGSNRV